MRCLSMNLLYYPFRQKVEGALNEVNKNGIPLKVFETFRTRRRQSELWAQGRTAPGKKITWVRPGESYHNYGLAVDLVLFIDGQWTWDYPELYRKAGPYFELQGLNWLGRSSNDLVHYQMKTRFKVEDLQSIYDDGGLESVWLALDM